MSSSRILLAEQLEDIIAVLRQRVEQQLHCITSATEYTFNGFQGQIHNHRVGQENELFGA